MVQFDHNKHQWISLTLFFYEIHRSLSISRFFLKVLSWLNKIVSIITIYGNVFKSLFGTAADCDLRSGCHVVPMYHFLMFFSCIKSVIIQQGTAKQPLQAQFRTTACTIYNLNWNILWISLLSGIPNGDFNKLAVNNANISSKIETPNVKKRHRRAKSGGLKSTDPSQGDGMYLSYYTEVSGHHWSF